jgi:hypothetical protein
MTMSYSRPITCAHCGCPYIARDPATVFCRPCGRVVAGERHRLRRREMFLAMLDEAVPGACLEWQGARHRQGYGVASLDGRPTKAHRVAFELVHGPIPDGLDVLHRCDNPPCWNPHHLFVGTARDNIRDSVAKGRWVRRKGEHHRDAKLTEADVLAIRASRERQVDLADKYGICQSVVSAIKLRKIWKHVP